MHPDEVLSFVRKHEDPCVTASEVVEEFDVTQRAANYRLKQLVKESKLESKTAGAAAKVYWAICP